PPVVAANRPEAAPEQKVEPKSDPKPEGKVAFTTNPKLRDGKDIALVNLWGVAWSPDGKRLAIHGNEDPAAAGGASGPRRPKHAVFLVTVQNGEVVRSERAFGGTLSPVATLVGFSPSGDDIITDQRETNLISGLHQLHYHALEFREVPQPLRKTS